jgi:hypothetical protein
MLNHKQYKCAKKLATSDYNDLVFNHKIYVGITCVKHRTFCNISIYCMLPNKPWVALPTFGICEEPSRIIKFSEDLDDDNVSLSINIKVIWPKMVL